MTSEKARADRPGDDELRVIATYRRNEQTALTRSQFFDTKAELHELLQWAREGEDMGIVLATLEIEVMGSGSQRRS